MAKHGVRAPRRTVVELREGAWGTVDGIFTCGHVATGRGSADLGFKGACYACQIAKAEELERTR